MFFKLLDLLEIYDVKNDVISIELHKLKLYFISKSQDIKSYNNLRLAENITLLHNGRHLHG